MFLIDKKITVDNPLTSNLRHIAKYDNVLFTTARLITNYNVLLQFTIAYKSRRLYYLSHVATSS